MNETHVWRLCRLWLSRGTHTRGSWTTNWLFELNTCIQNISWHSSASRTRWSHPPCKCGEFLPCFLLSCGMFIGWLCTVDPELTTFASPGPMGSDLYLDTLIQQLYGGLLTASVRIRTMWTQTSCWNPMGNPSRSDNGDILSPCSQLCSICAMMSLTGSNLLNQHSKVSDTAQDGNK